MTKTNKNSCHGLLTDSTDKNGKPTWACLVVGEKGQGRFAPCPCGTVLPRGAR